MRLHPDEAFETLQRVLAGDEVSLDHSHGTEKTLRCFSPIFSDYSRVDIEPEGAHVRHYGDPRHHRYFVKFAPAAVQDLMKRMGLRSCMEPTVGRLPAQDREPRPLALVECCVWLIPNDEVVTLFFARASAVQPPRSATPLRDADAWPLPDLPPAFPWVGTGPKYGQRAALGSCPHCGRSDAQWKQLEESIFVCTACGRSFDWK